MILMMILMRAMVRLLFKSASMSFLIYRYGFALCTDVALPMNMVFSYMLAWSVYFRVLQLLDKLKVVF